MSRSTALWKTPSIMGPVIKSVYNIWMEQQKILYFLSKSKCFDMEWAASVYLWAALSCSSTASQPLQGIAATSSSPDATSTRFFVAHQPDAWLGDEPSGCRGQGGRMMASSCPSPAPAVCWGNVGGCGVKPHLVGLRGARALRRGAMGAAAGKAESRCEAIAFNTDFTPNERKVSCC